MRITVYFELQSHLLKFKDSYVANPRAVMTVVLSDELLQAELQQRFLIVSWKALGLSVRTLNIQ